MSIRQIAPLVAALIVSGGAAGAEEEPPSKGTGFIITGSIFTGVGVINAAVSPICLLYRSDIKDACLIASFIVAGAFTAVGVPLLIVGISKRSSYKEWQEQHRVLSGFDLQPMPGGAFVSWQARF